MRQCLTASNACLHSSVQSNMLAPLSVRKKMLHLVNETSYEANQSCQMACKVLQFIFVIQSRYFQDGFHLSQINFNSPLGYHKPQKFLCTDVEGTFNQIELHIVCLYQTECFFQVLNMLNLGLILYKNVINVDFHSSIDLRA